MPTMVQIAPEEESLLLQDYPLYQITSSYVESHGIG
jgi:hypothetical protein